MSVREYVGARYVPIVVGEWDKTRTYEPLMVVTYQGNSYTSRQYVPAGIEITNESYWVLSANYNAQVEAYRNEVSSILPYDETPTEGSTKGVTSDGISKTITSETTRATQAEQALRTRIDTTETNIAHLDAQMAATTGSELLNRITEIKSKFPVSTDSIADGAITSNKIAPSGIASILNGFTIHRFDNKDSGSDNSGLVAPSDVKLSGFYIDELSILVIDNLYGTSPWLTTENTIKLPDYVPHVNSTTLLAKSCVIRYVSGVDFKSWTGIQLMSSGYIRPVGNISDTSYTIMGTLTFFLRPYVTNSQTMNNYDSLVSQNGVL